MHAVSSFPKLELLSSLENKHRTKGGKYSHIIGFKVGFSEGEFAGLLIVD